RGAVENRAEPAVTGGELGLPFQQLGNLVLHELLVEELTAGDAVDLRPQRRDAILIGLLHASLARQVRTDQVIAQHEVGCREQVADGDRKERRSCERGQPGPDREMPYLIAAGDDDRMGFFTPAEDRGPTRCAHGPCFPTAGDREPDYTLLG